jgi:hypothetical protein
MKLSAAAKSDKEKTKALLKTITLGELLRLRDDVYQLMRTREWIFRRFNEDSTIFLMHESGGFGWSIKIDDIDWEAYRRSKKGIAKAECLDNPADFRDPKSFLWGLLWVIRIPQPLQRK